MVRDLRFLLQTHYAGSHALIVGIDQYTSAPPLAYAVNDAKEIRELLIGELEFPAANVTYLINGAATRQAILKAFFRFTKSDIGLDDRIFVFFAGHGHTVSGIRGEVGYLVPHDGDPSDYSTLIRWNELTHNSELVRAKHMLFIMDACYGGLALTRNTQPGSTRFLKDMLLRYSRQVLTAGKADEVVADSGGPLPEHSVFTGHLIEALRGKAATEDGVITASSVMAYVYRTVAADRNSNQTPHYGHFDGDGDFILMAPCIKELESPTEKDIDRLITISYSEQDVELGRTESNVVRIKRLLANDTSAIELHDLLVQEVRAFLSRTSEDNFAISGDYSRDEFISRLSRYETASLDLAILLACVAHWSKAIHIPTLQKCLARSADRLGSRGGLSIWLALRWYPLVLELYCAGIGAVSGQRFDSLAATFYAPVTSDSHNSRDLTFAEAIGKQLAELSRSNALKQIPGHDRNFVPLSEYLFKVLQPKLDDALFLGKDYEWVFDTFEVYFALVVADLRQQAGATTWGPVGRFGWKRHSETAPLARVIAEAKSMGGQWLPLRAGLFGGTYERFEKVSTEYAQAIAQLPWY